VTSQRATRTKRLFQVAVVTTVVVALGAGIAWLQQTTPRTVQDLSVPGLPVLSQEVVTCERTLPDRPTAPVDPEALAPVGRVSSTEVIACPDRFDGRVVLFAGEVVGDVLRRDGGAWVLLNDDAYALDAGPLDAHGERLGANTGLSVWLDGDLADLADTPGDSRRRGDVLLVEGVLHRADPADGGGLTVRAFAGEVLVPAVEFSQHVHRVQAVVAVVLALLATAGALLERRRAARE
jgi:hypothetical protein